MKKQVAVIGLGRLGASLAETLSSIGHDVLAIDRDETLVQEIAPRVTHAVQADPTSEAALRKLGISNFDIAIVTIPEVEQNVLATILVKKLSVRYIIARATSELHESILMKIGADKVFFPEREMGTGIAYVLTLGNIIDYIPVTSGYGVVKMSVPLYFFGKTLSELEFSSFGTNKVVVLLIQRKRDIIINPAPSEKIDAEDVLVVSGNWDKLEELFSKIQSPA